MNRLPPDVVKTLCSFNQSEWANWIWQRTHGMDSKTSLSVFNDPFPENAVQDAWDNIVLESYPETYKKNFFEGLKSSLNKTIWECEELIIKIEKPSSRILKCKVAAIQSHFNIINYLEDEELKYFKQSHGGLQICESGFEFVYYNRQFNREKSPLLRRVIIEVCSRIGVVIPDNILEMELESNGVALISFMSLCQTNGVNTITDYFPSLVKNLFLTKKEFMIEEVIDRLKELYIKKEKLSNELKKALGKALRKIEEEERNQYIYTKQKIIERGLSILPPLRRVQDAIKQRKSLRIAKSNFPLDLYWKLTGKIANKILNKHHSYAYTIKPYKQFEQYYQDIITEINQNGIDFLHDPYYLTRARGQSVDIMEFGKITHFCCIVNTKNAMEMLPQYREDNLGNYVFKIIKDHHLNFSRMLEIIKNTQLGATSDFKPIKIGIYGDSASAAEVRQAVLNNIDIEVIRYNTVENIFNFLCSEDKEYIRLAFIDYDIQAILMDRASKKKYTYSKGRLTDDLKELTRINFDFAFIEPIPVGFVYPSHDPEWGDIIRWAFGEVLEKNWEILRWQEIGKELYEKTRIIAFSEEEMFTELGRRDFYLKKMQEESKNQTSHDIKQPQISNYPT